MACNIDGAPPTNIAHAEIEVGQTIDAHYDKRFKIPSEPPPGTEWPSGKVETWGHQVRFLSLLTTTPLHPLLIRNQVTKPY